MSLAQSSPPSNNNNQSNSNFSGKVEKAFLVQQSPQSGRVILFQFNPTDISFNYQIEVAQEDGTQDKITGLPSVSYSDIKPLVITLKEIWFDTYEERISVREKYIQPFLDAFKFAEGMKRTAIWGFYWGKEIKIDFCFMEEFQYRYTMFLRDGMPVRAVIDSLTLKETSRESARK